MHEEASDDMAFMHFLLTLVEEMGRRGVVAEFDLATGVFQVGGHEYHDLDEAIDHCCAVLRSPAVVQ